MNCPEGREAQGLTQKQLAEAAGVRQSAVARLETLKAAPQIDMLFKVLTPMGYKLAIVPAYAGKRQALPWLFTIRISSGLPFRFTGADEVFEGKK